MSILVGRKAPDFTAPAVLGKGELVEAFNLQNALKGKYGLLFFYPLDFTFVCPSELIALDHHLAAFQERGVEVIAISVDSHFAHHAWRKTPIEKGGIGEVRYTLVGDISHQISLAYGVEHPEQPMALRAAFLVDQQGVVRAEIVHDLPLGRNIDELLRLVDALQHHEQVGEVCPAGWKKGEKAMTPSLAGVRAYLSSHSAGL